MNYQQQFVFERSLIDVEYKMIKGDVQKCEFHFKARKRKRSNKKKSYYVRNNKTVVEKISIIHETPFHNERRKRDLIYLKNGEAFMIHRSALRSYHILRAILTPHSAN